MSQYARTLSASWRRTVDAQFAVDRRRQRSVSLYRKGMTLTAIGALICVSYVTVRLDLVKAGVDRRRQGRPNGVHRRSRLDYMRWLRREGWSIKRIGRHYGITHQAVSNYLKKHKHET